MKCSKCGFENSEANKFCSECGAKFESLINETQTVKKAHNKAKAIIITIIVIVLIAIGIHEAYIQIYWGGREMKKTLEGIGDGISEFSQKIDEAESNSLTFDKKDMYTNAYSHSDIEDYTISLFKIECNIKEIISNKGKSYECIIEFDNQLFYVEYLNPYEKIELNEKDKITLYGTMRTTNDMYVEPSNSTIQLRKIFAIYIEK